jgi:hypothetical protein
MKNGLVNQTSPAQSGLMLAILGALLCGACQATALSWSSGASSHKKSPKTAEAKGRQASQPPAFSIPVEPLGFYPPGPYYLGQRETLVSLDFVDENRLLFTFRAPGLMHRSNVQESERQIRAQILTLPKGVVEAEALWMLHDHDRYLWMLRGGHFLLRDQNSIREGDSSLQPRPLLQFPGPLISLSMDPDQRYLVTNSDEPASVKPQAGQVESPPTAQADASPGDAGEQEKRNVVLRILDRKSGQVMLVTRVRAPVRMPINGEGFIETLPGLNKDWIVSFESFKGGSRVVGRVNSSCQPPVEFIARDEAILNACAFQDGRRLIAMSLEGKRLWDATSPATQIWPILVASPDGSRLVRETLTMGHSIEEFGHALDPQDIKGQLVEVFDAAKGKMLLQAQANAVLDGGGNVAVSPSGNRIAILNGEAIDVYDLANPPTDPGFKPTGSQSSSQVPPQPH